VDKPWLSGKKSKSRLVTDIIPLIGLAAGLAIVAVYAYTGWAKYDTAKFCPVWTEDFSGGLDPNVWQREVQIGGFGNGQFEYATDDEANSHVKDGMLYITPTVGEPWEDGATLNLTSQGICTATGDLTDLDKNCYAIQNVTGGEYIPVVRSARLTTRLSKSMKYGKLEIRAKLPVGDWIWPAIWMMPKDSVYGAWPASGEIDIVESRGNGHDYFVYQGDPKDNKRFPAGNNAIGSTLHWGGDTASNKFYMTTNGYHYPSAINGLTDAFHTYGMEWTPNGIRIYVDKQLTRVVYFSFPKQGFWSWGNFATNIVNPWFGGTKASPFDQEFYLILNVAIGGTNGYFADNVNEKPWTNGLKRGQALNSFQRANETWLPTWKQPSLIVDSVKMWEIC
ncbi:concanavalin A-like lectin/glucanase domain-containing protein, partial [Protomyces lactucae-debilis]